jgi:acyl-CoA reductase-like NAD-dependent aldehyde dehydrogenase
VGKLIASKAGYKRTVLELGGNDPLIILNDLNDADLEKAATIAVAGAIGNSGQRYTHNFLSKLYCLFRSHVYSADSTL